MDLQAWKARARVLYEEADYVENWDSEEIWDSDLKLDEKLEVMFDLFEETGSSYILADIWFNRDADEEHVAHYMLTRYRKYLSGDDKLLEKLAAEDLAVGLFEDPKWQREAWSYILKEPWNDQLIRNVLLCSGAVPYDLRRRLYDRLLSDKKWHVPIARSIYSGIIQIYGDIDWEDAKKVFSKLTFPEKLDSDDSAIINYLRSKIHDKFSYSIRDRWIRDAPKEPTIKITSFMKGSIVVTVNNVGGYSPHTIDEVWVNDVKQTDTKPILPKTIAVGKQAKIEIQYDWQAEKYYDVKLVTSEGHEYLCSRPATAGYHYSLGNGRIK